MDKNRIEGIGHQIMGTFKEGLGKIIGDAKLTADGTAEKSVGEAQSAAAASGSQVMGIDADRIVGIGHQLKGAVRQGLGRVAGDPTLEQGGIAEREAGKIQNAAGSARDEAREAVEAKREGNEKGEHEFPSETP
jgi:uncharacterized protein YjbJ (UPF0337 family)